jgi:hypothetical protein
METDMKVERRTVDLASYPDPGRDLPGHEGQCPDRNQNRVRFRPKIANSVAAMPDGLLRHESMVYSLLPPHVGMRQYWRDFESLERWARSEPHMQWWKNFLRDSGGTGF